MPSPTKPRPELDEESKSLIAEALLEMDVAAASAAGAGREAEGE